MGVVRASARRELLAELNAAIDKLSDGEIRALVAEYGPLGEYGCEIPARSRRPRCRDPEAMRLAVEALDTLRALMKRQ